MRLLVECLALCLPAILAAQGIRVSGSVVRVSGAAREPVAGATVVLHRVGQAGEGPVDSARTTALGNYRFLRPDADSAAHLLASVHHHGVAYVSDEGEGRAGAVRFPPIVVFDTSSAAPVELAQRHLLVRAADRDGSRAVLDLIVLRNPGTRTRLAAATWRGLLLDGAVDALLPGAESNLTGDAARIRGDTLTISAPIPPGDRQVALSYILPASRRLTLVIDQPAGTLALMLADTVATVVSGAIEDAGIREFEGEPYRRLEATNPAVGDSLVIALPPPPLRAAGLWWLVVVGAAGVLGAAAAKWWRAPLAKPNRQP